MLVTLIIYCDDIFYCYYLFIVYYYSAMVGLVFIVVGGCGRLVGGYGDFLCLVVDYGVTYCHEVLYRVVLWRLEVVYILWFYVLPRGVRVYCARTRFWVEFTSRIKCTVSWVHLGLSICFA